jgi:hypothetical protein
MNYTEISLAVGTWALVVATFAAACWLVSEQRRAAQAQEEMLRTDLRVRTQLLFIDRFDSPQVIRYRAALARDFLNHAPHDQIKEEALNFFEDLGLFYRRGFLDEELVWSTFGFYAVRWWMAAYEYIKDERQRTSDPTNFDDFEELAKVFRKLDAQAHLPEPTPSQLNVFLQDEANLENLTDSRTALR